MRRMISLIFPCLFLLASSVHSQDNPMGRGSLMLSGTASFSSAGGNLYKDADDNRLNFIALSPSANYFILNNLFLGAGLGYLSLSQGDKTLSALGAGPNLGYAFGGSQSKTRLYLFASFRYDGFKMDDRSRSGTESAAGLGLIVFGSERLGLTVEGSYRILANKLEDADKNEYCDVIGVGIGLAGFLH